MLRSLPLPGAGAGECGFYDEFTLRFLQRAEAGDSLGPASGAGAATDDKNSQERKKTEETGEAQDAGAAGPVALAQRKKREEAGGRDKAARAYSESTQTRYTHLLNGVTANVLDLRDLLVKVGEFLQSDASFLKLYMTPNDEIYKRALPDIVLSRKCVEASVALEFPLISRDLCADYLKSMPELMKDQRIRDYCDASNEASSSTAEMKVKPHGFRTDYYKTHMKPHP